MNEPILFAIWLAYNCKLDIYGAYTLISTDRLYYINSKLDMESLFDEYLGIKKDV
jgi:hypothetical protein